MQKKQIDQLLKELDRQMEKAAYSVASQKNHRTVWRIILRHMEEEQYPFNEHAIRKVMKKHYSNEFGKPLTRGFGNYFRSANLLCEYLKTGSLTRKNRKKIPSVECEIVNRLRNFMLNVRKNSSRTVKAYNYIWQELAVYANEHSYGSFETSWVMPYLNKKYGIVKGKLPHKKRIIRRAGEVLCDFAAYGKISRRRRTQEIVLSREHDILLNALDEYRNLHQLAESTYMSMQYNLVDFADFMQKNYLDFSSFSIKDMHKYINTISRYSLSAKANKLYALRCVFRIMYDNGIVASDFSNACAHVRIYKYSHIPSTYSVCEVQKILNSVDRSTALGKRNYAILLIASRLGMRAFDIKNLKFENLNWQLGEIRFVQHKTQNELVLPLTEEIGDALIDYLRNGRPEADSGFLFVRHLAPYEPFADTYKFNNIVIKHFALAEINVPKGKAHGIHSFRHSLAGNMLSAKTPLPVISSVLGHSDCSVTCQYIKVDIEQLRQCALEICFGGEGK